MTGRLKDIIFTRNGEQIISFVTKSDFSETFDELKDVDVDVKIKKYRGHRSIDANAYCWVLIDKLAAKLSLPKQDVYRNAIRNIGGVSDVLCIKESAFDLFEARWCKKGLGRQVEKMPSKIAGCVTAVVYYGSSEYDAKQMCNLIDIIVQDCKALGIPTETPEQIAKIKALWAQDGENRRPEKKGN